MNEKLPSVIMSTENGFQESQFSASSNIRRKVDVLNGRENGDSKEQMLPDSKCNLRTSLAWDSAFFTSPGVLEPEELFTTLNSRNYDNVVNILGNEEHFLLSSQSLEPDTNCKAENYNFRKSLAWDNGFFTSEGVLNPFELAIVNNGFKKSESHLLPVIEDEVWRSVESNNTLDSEGSSLTRLEMDLFEDIRTSIPEPISSRLELGRPGSVQQDGFRTMKTMPTCKRHSINNHRPKKITIEMSKTPKVQLKKHSGGSREYYSSSPLKPSKASEQTKDVSRGSTKRASLGEKHVQLGCGSRIGILAAEGLEKLKKPCLRDSFNAIHGSTQSLRSSLSRCSTPTNRSVSCVTSNVSCRPPSEITNGKLPPPNLRRKVNSQALNVLVVSPTSTTPLMKTRANKSKVESSCLSTPTSTWYGSPSSSIKSNKCKHSPYSSSTSSRMENENQESGNRCQRKDHKGDGNTNTSGMLREVKPSGLRMPSPKLGFFDTENMSELATNTDAVQGVVHRIRCTKLQSPRTLLGTEIRHHKNGGTLVSAIRSNRSPTVKLYNKNQTMKAEKIIKQYPKLGLEIYQEDNKENENNFVDCQIDGLVEQVNYIDLNN